MRGWGGVKGAEEVREGKGMSGQSALTVHIHRVLSSIQPALKTSEYTLAQHIHTHTCILLNPTA